MNSLLNQLRGRVRSSYSIAKAPDLKETIINYQLKFLEEELLQCISKEVQEMLQQNVKEIVSKELQPVIRKTVRQTIKELGSKK